MVDSGTDEYSKEVISKLYLINLDKRQDRLNFFKQTVAQKSEFIRNNCVRCNGIDGSQLSDDLLYSIISDQGKRLMIENPQSKGLFLTKGAIGLALTYKHILETCYVNTMILEDDIDIIDNFDHELFKAFSMIPSDWDILYLGWCDSVNLKISPVNDAINALNGQINGTHGWIINPASAKKLLSIFPITYQIDTEIYIKPLIKKYGTNQKLVLRKNMGSDIQ